MTPLAVDTAVVQGERLECESIAHWIDEGLLESHEIVLRGQPCRVVMPEQLLAFSRAPWKTREALELAALEWVSWLNSHRLMAPLGYVPPAEFEANYYRNLEQPVMPA